MKRAKAPRAARPEAGHAAGGGSSRRGPRLRRAWLLAPLLAVAVAATLRFGAPERPAAAPERLPDLPAPAAYDSALILSRAGRHEASLPYYRRALQGAGEGSWMAHYNYAAALYNVSLEVRERYGVPTPVTRSSIERVALTRAALAHLDTAERLAPTPADRVRVLRARAERMTIWGMPWDAFMQYRQAQWTVPSQPALVQAAEGYMLIMREPDRQWVPGTAPAAR